MTDEEMSRLEQQMRFLVEIDKEKEILRQNYLASGNRREGDAEHAWHLAMMAFLLSEHSNEKIDVARTVFMVLIHDLVEIDAGDTYIYGNTSAQEKREKELAAAERIFNILPADQAEYVRGLWDEFEARETAEAKFAFSLDKLQPLLLNDASDGKSWREHGIHAEQVYGVNEHTHEGSEAIWEFVKRVIEKNRGTNLL